MGIIGLAQDTLGQSTAWTDVLQRLREIGYGAAMWGLGLLLAIALLLVGWALATLLSQLVRAALRGARFNEGMRGILGVRATARHEPAAVAAWAVYWAILGFAILVALEALGLNVTMAVRERLGDVVPRIVSATVIFVLGVVVAMLLGALTRRFFETGELRGARLRGQVVSWVLTAVAALLALEQLGFAAQFIIVLGGVALGAIGLAVGLAFGLGCRDLARDFVVEYLRSLQEAGPKRPS